MVEAGVFFLFILCSFLLDCNLKTFYCYICSDTGTLKTIRDFQVTFDMTKTEQLIETLQDLSEEQVEQLLHVAVRMRETAIYPSLPASVKEEIDLAILEDEGDDKVSLSEFMREVNEKIERSDV